MIPRIIHQIWLGPLTPPSKALDSWKKKHPEWEYHLWTEDNLPEMKNKQAFDLSDNYPQKADILRYELLEQFGGVYVDADVHCVKPIDSLFGALNEQGSDLVAAYEGREDDDSLIANTVMMAEKGNSFISKLVTDIDVEKEGQAWEITGPQYLTEKIAEIKPKIRLLPSKCFYPVHHKDKGNRLITLSDYDSDSEVYGVHMWSGTKRGYLPVWYKNPFKFVVYIMRKALNKTFQIKPE